MDNFMPDSSQLKSLKTWYPVGHDLHFNPRHPCIKLAGEAGELLDLYGKEEYKPNFSWWNCKYCGLDVNTHNILLGINEDTKVLHACLNYIPLVLDELGDYSYYLRILAYQKGMTFEALCSYYNVDDYVSENLLDALAHLNDKSAWILTQYVAHQQVRINDLQIATLVFLAILHKLDYSLENLLDLNYKKLNSEESHHGWRDATIKSRA